MTCTCSKMLKGDMHARSLSLFASSNASLLVVGQQEVGMLITLGYISPHQQCSGDNGDNEQTSQRTIMARMDVDSEDDDDDVDVDDDHYVIMLYIHNEDEVRLYNERLC